MHSDLEAGGLAGYPEQVHPLRLDRLRGLQTRRTGDPMSYTKPNIFISLTFIISSSLLTSS
jgi:hypothetical protein